MFLRFHTTHKLPGARSSSDPTPCKRRVRVFAPCQPATTLTVADLLWLRATVVADLLLRSALQISVDSSRTNRPHSDRSECPRRVTRTRWLRRGSYHDETACPHGPNQNNRQRR